MVQDRSPCLAAVKPSTNTCSLGLALCRPGTRSASGSSGVFLGDVLGPSFDPGIKFLMWALTHIALFADPQGYIFMLACTFLDHVFPPAK
jgi:hypothetical protein